jgi:hypothetical protein
MTNADGEKPGADVPHTRGRAVLGRGTTYGSGTSRIATARPPLNTAPVSTL